MDTIYKMKEITTDDFKEDPLLWRVQSIELKRLTCDFKENHFISCVQFNGSMRLIKHHRWDHINDIRK